MTVAPHNESHGKSLQATFLKVGQNLYRNESSDTYYGLTKRGGKQFRTALRTESGAPIKDRGLAERALRIWLDEIENINPATLTSSGLFAIIEKSKEERPERKLRPWSAASRNGGSYPAAESQARDNRTSRPVHSQPCANL